MKKKLIFAIATGFFAVATVLNMNVLPGHNAGDVSLDSIAVMAQAQGDESSNKSSNRRCVIWDGECWPTLSEDPDWPACSGC
ncbi:hypothetical protein EV194_109149 [Natronoflexus pectinivorans]|uniref:Uncharacterized protein n=1 Tax=Natronoflexus pectinivorans TaxID=682526 RepID=A0A4R2GHP5_9BACT|nr:hypothetical protein EV194_109149 [Natronoflexus pectinivorans]